MDDDQPKSKKQSFKEWIGSPSFFIYLNYLCSQWGDWMWLFASGLYLVQLDENKLRLAAAFGFACGGCILLFGGLIGEWVDRHQRLYVVRVALFTQNMSVMISAICVGVALHLENIGSPLWFGPLRSFLEAAIITFAILAQLASIGYKISIEKDWIVVVAKGNKSALANLNAVIRAIDLSAKILAPTSVGLIMSYGSCLLSAIVIAGWNLVSVFVEYGILKAVYNKVPELANKKVRTSCAGQEKEEEMKVISSSNMAATEEKEPLRASNGTSPDAKKAESDPEVQPLNAEKDREATEEAGSATGEETACRSCLRVTFDPVIMLVFGWKTYARQKVVFAGLALATLYMTVMGFDSVTTGYIYSTGLPEWGVGLSMALAGVTGIMSTFIFTVLRRRIGLERTGLIAFNLEIICLTLAVASVWAPGSPFDPGYLFRKPDNCSVISVKNATNRIQSGLFSMHEEEQKLANASGLTEGRFRRSVISVDHLAMMNMPEWWAVNPWEEGEGKGRYKRESSDEGVTRESKYSVVSPGEKSTVELSAEVKVDCAKPYEGPNISIILFLIGIITSRTGLWMADLVVTQLLQENVVETERGVVNGIQNSLNMLMEMAKFVLVIVLPHSETFGILIIISFIFICIAALFFASHSYRVRGHLFHFEKCLCNNNHGERGPPPINPIVINVDAEAPPSGNKTPPGGSGMTPSDNTPINVV